MLKNLSFKEKVALVANIVVATLLVFAFFISYQDTNLFSFFAIVHLLVPLLVILNVLFFCFWLIKRKKQFIPSFLVLAMGYFVFGSFYKIGNSLPEEAHDLSIMSYNVMGFNRFGWIEGTDIGDQITSFIKAQDPDVLCIQEHSRIRYQQLTQYAYRSETPYSSRRSHQAIFSKYPIVAIGSLDLPQSGNNIIFADLLFNEDTLRVYNVHLESFNIVPNSETLSNGQSEKTYNRMINTFEKQLQQAKYLKEHISKTSHKILICGDFNNTQFSNVYRLVKNGYHDSFLEAGSGFGKTYDLKGLPVRIDYILTDDSFEVIKHTNFKERLSDHYPVMATLKIKP
ncbi:MAG: endonuclease/exonuclease/phosphatase family protein [Croceitalea sp.]|nr:endonuclease/exonuclease/phosphatase family protein [Croceitalea sp.]